MACVDENSVVELIQGLLSPAARSRIEQHLDACADCRRLVAEVAKLSFAGKSSRSSRPELEPCEERGEDPAFTSTLTGRESGGSSAPGTASGPGGGELQVLPEQVLAGRFRIVRRLGRGSFGAVYEAEDLQLKERVALKLLRPEVQRNPSLLGHLHHEIVVGRRVSHPHVCRIHDLGTWGESHFISMALVEGESLDRFLEHCRPPLEVAAQILGQIASALEAAHGEGVVHRDLKPSNIMVATGGSRGIHVTVMDFGLARDLRAGPSLSGALIGSPAYWSPEQARGERATERSDLYTLGLIACDLFGITRPGFGVAASLGGLPAGFRSIVERSLRPRPEDRFASAHELVRALERAGRRERSGSRRTLRLTALISLGAVLGGVGVFLLLRSHPGGVDRGTGVTVARPLEAGLGPSRTVLVAADAATSREEPRVDLGSRSPIRKPRKPAKAIAAAPDARIVSAPKRDSGPGIPRPAIALAALRERLGKLEAERRRRAILLDDLPGARASLAEARRALAAAEQRSAESALGRLEQSLQGVVIDGTFISRKLARLNRLKAAKQLDPAREKQVTAIFGVVHQRFFSGDFAGANAQLNSIFALLGHAD